MIDQFRLTDPLGVVVEASINDPRATSILSTLGLYGGLGVRVDKQDRLTDGTVPARVARTGRSWTPGGRIIGLSDQGVVEWALRIGGLFGGSDNDSTGLLEISQGDLQLHAEVQLDGEPKIDAARDLGYVVWEIPLYSADPHLYGPPQAAHLTQEDVGVGLIYPLFVDGVLSFGDAVASEAILSNSGNATAYPVYVATGDWPSGFTIRQGGGMVTFAASCSADSPVTVDMAGSVTVGGLDRTHLCTRAVWAGVAPGASVEPKLLAPQGLGWADATIKPTWL